MADISSVRIANMALSNVGAASTIESFDEASTEAKQCKLWYDYSRLQALEAFDWSFARKRLVLAAHSDDPPEARWIYRYQYPADCVAARYIENPLGVDADKVPYQVETSDDNGSKTILTNVSDAALVYTFDLQSPALFSAHFVETLSHLLASHIAFTLTGKRTIKGDMIQTYRSLLRAAPAQNANEQSETKPREADWIRGRV